MNDLNQDQAIPTEQQHLPPVAFCQNCGKPLDTTSARTVGNAVFCEPCLVSRLNAQPAQPRPADTSAAGTQPAWTSSSAAQPGQPATGLPSPGLAAWLGFIPGVGAMYNEQYAKGIVHLIIFTIIVSLTNASDVFIIFVFGWEAYMAIEAHHTAKARRDGLPLPNPFGLNDIGERMGFGKAWPTGTTTADTFRDAAQSARAGFSSTATTPNQPPYYGQQQPVAWGAPSDTPPVNYQASQPAGNPGGYSPYPTDYTAGSNAWQAAQGIPVSSYMPPVPPYLPPVNRFPAGAVWLIGLGAFFLLATTGVFHAFPAHVLIGLALIGLGIWMFLRRMNESGSSLVSDGSPQYSYRILRALRVSIWLVLAGAWFLLDAFHIVSMNHSWPLFVILAGVMTLLERATASAAATASFTQTQPFTPTPTPPMQQPPATQSASTPTPSTPPAEAQQIEGR